MQKQEPPQCGAALACLFLLYCLVQAGLYPVDAIGLGRDPVDARLGVRAVEGPVDAIGLGRDPVDACLRVGVYASPVHAVCPCGSYTDCGRPNYYC